MDMDQAYFLEILAKYRAGTATPAEEQFLLACYEAFESQPDIVALLTEEERTRLKQSLHKGIMQQIAEHGAPVRQPGRRWLKIAAAAAMIAGAAAIGLRLFKEPDAPPVASLPEQTVQPEKENNLIALPDGSSVLVSAGSRLHYPTSFSGKTREVYLVGRALFNVAQQVAKPFVVHSGQLSTTVLGTTFEVDAVTPDVRVTVLEGRVQVASEKRMLGVLSANEQIVYNATSQNHRQVQLPASAPQPAWLQNDLLFDDVSLQQAARLIAERFNTSISIPDETLQQQRFTTTFTRDENLEQVLKSICDFNHAAYKIDKEKNTVIIYRP